MINQDYLRDESWLEKTPAAPPSPGNPLVLDDVPCRSWASLGQKTLKRFNWSAQAGDFLRQIFGEVGAEGVLY